MMMDPAFQRLTCRSTTTAIDHPETQLDLDLGSNGYVSCLDSAGGDEKEELYTVDDSMVLENANSEMYSWLTPTQVVTLTAAIVDEAGENLFSAAECDRAFEWADKSLVNYTLLQKVLDGSLQIRLREDGEPFFVLPKANTQLVCP